MAWRLVLEQGHTPAKAKGHKVLAPDLPGHGDDKTPTATVTLKSYTDRICEIAGAQAEPVILAGHSMGGVAITQAGEYCPNQIRALVYLCAFLPRNGDTLMTWASQDRESMVNLMTVDPRPNGVLALRPEYAREAFYGNCTDEDVASCPVAPCRPIRRAFWNAGRNNGLPAGVKSHAITLSAMRDRALTLTLQQRCRSIRHAGRRSPSTPIIRHFSPHRRSSRIFFCRSEITRKTDLSPHCTERYTKEARSSADRCSNEV